MIGLTLESVKQNILERQKIEDKVERATERALSKFGAFVRQRAWSSLQSRKKISAAGQPPSNHTGAIKDHILFIVEMASRNVVIGPQLLNASFSKTTLRALEHGGPSVIRMRKRGAGSHGRVYYENRPINVTARPFMQPAFDEELKHAPKLWENALR